MIFKHSKQRLLARIKGFSEIEGKAYPKVIEAIQNTPRHEFLSKIWASQAYDEKTIPIGKKQTISLPSIVCQMTTQLFAHCRHQKILEIGTGSGYQSAILAALWKEVYTIERIESLSLKAQKSHKKLAINNIYYAHGDGFKGWSEEILFDAIMITAWAPEIPHTLLKQLCVGGYLIAPTGAAENKQFLVLIRRQHLNSYQEKKLIDTHFVPMLQGVID